jgi:hypothetical protein
LTALLRISTPRNILSRASLENLTSRVRLSIGRLEDETRKTSGKMNDVLARAACALEDDPLCRQDITKDIDNEIAIAQRYRTHVGGGRSSSARVPRASAAE